MITLEITNTRCTIHGASSEALKLVDRSTRYIADEQQHREFLERLQQPDLPPDLNSPDDPQHTWDGMSRFLRRPAHSPPWTNAGLRWVVRDALLHGRYPVQVHDTRSPPEPGLPEIPPIPLRGYQEGCVAALQTYGPPAFERRKDGVLVAPPRAGKTRTMGEHVRRLWLPTIWLAPSREIAAQTVRALREFFGDRVRLGRSRNLDEVRDALIIVATVQGALKFPPEFWAARHVLVCDEVHHILADNTWGRALTKLGSHISYRFGMSGTFFRSNGDDLAMHAFLSDVAQEITSEFLLSRGYLCPVYFGAIPVPGTHRQSSKKWVGPEGLFTRGIQQYRPRQDLVMRAAYELAIRDYRTIVLVATKQQGHALKHLLAPHLPRSSQHHEFDTVEFVSTDETSARCGNIMDSFRERQEVRVLIGTSMVGEGVDLPSADGMVNAAGGKAAVSLTQAWYRVATAETGKTASVILDFDDRHHRKLQEHSTARIELAHREPIFRVTQFEQPLDFVEWLGV